MHLARLHQAQPAGDALGVAPVKADVVRKGAVHGLVVGIAQNAGGRVHEPRVVGIGEDAQPAVFRQPALGRHSALALVLGVTARHGADDLHGDAIPVRQHQVLRGRHEQFPRRQPVGHGPRLHHADGRRHRGIRRRECGPGYRGDMSRRGDRRQIEMGSRQNRAILGPAQGQRDGWGILDGQDRPAGFEIGPAIRGAVLFRIVGIELFDMHVLIIEIGRGQAPSHRFGPAQQHGGNPRNGRPDHPPGRQLQPGQVPHRGGAEIKVRIIGQQGAARSRPVRGRRPGVRCAAHAGLRKGRQRRVGQPHRICTGLNARHKIGIVRQGGNARAGIVGKQVAHAGIGQQQRGAGPPHFRGQVGGELQRHQLEDRNRIRRLPHGDFRFEQEELGRAPAARTTVDLTDPGVHAIGIGLQRQFGLRILGLDRLQGQSVDVVAAQDLVNADGALAKGLGQAPLRGAAQLCHLPQTVLGMGKAQGEIDVFILGPEDMGHIGVVAHDLDRGRDAGKRKVFGVIGQRARQEIVAGQQTQKAQHHKAGEQPQEPAEGKDHGGSEPGA